MEDCPGGRRECYLPGTPGGLGAKKWCMSKEYGKVFVPSEVKYIVAGSYQNRGKQHMV